MCVRCWEVSHKAVFKLRCALLGESRVCKSSAHVCAIGRIPSLFLLPAKVHQWEDYKNLMQKQVATAAVGAMLHNVAILLQHAQ